MTEMALDAVLSHPYYEDEDVAEQIADRCIDFDTLSAALPDERHQLPPEGAWIIVTGFPTTSIPDPPLYSLWFARPVYYAREFRKVSAGGRIRNVRWPLLRARIVTPHGELTLLPREFLKVLDLRKWLDEVGNGVTLHLLDETADDTLTERLFYLRARGLRPSAALELLLPETTSQDVAWLSLDGTDVEGYVAGSGVGAA
jgi:hypothetical protein